MFCRCVRNERQFFARPNLARNQQAAVYAQGENAHVQNSSLRDPYYIREVGSVSPVTLRGRSLGRAGLRKIPKLRSNSQISGTCFVLCLVYLQWPQNHRADPPKPKTVKVTNQKQMAHRTLTPKMSRTYQFLNLNNQNGTGIWGPSAMQLRCLTVTSYGRFFVKKEIQADWVPYRPALVYSLEMGLGNTLNNLTSLEISFLTPTFQVEYFITQ